MKLISLEDKVLNVMGRAGLEKAGPLIFSIESEINRNIKPSSESAKAVKIARYILGSYSGVYMALQQHISQEIKNPLFESSYLSYVSSSAAIQKFRGYEFNDSLTKNNILSKQNGKNKDLLGIVKEIYECSRNTSSFNSLYSNMIDTISNNVAVSASEMMNPLFAEEKSRVEELVVNGNGFCVKFPKMGQEIKEIKELNREEDHIRKLRTHNLVPICREEIIGNEESIKLIETDVPCLLAYDNLEQRNPFSRFSSYMMFVGSPGTGKTMLARYAMTLGSNLAEKYQKPFSLVQLDIKDSWKNGSFLNLQNQFNEISSGDRIYMIFADEIDQALSENDDHGAEEQFLRFRGGAEYSNKGNYMFLATSNKPGNMHKGIMRIFNVINVEGPRTPEEKIKVLQNNLLSQTDSNYICINDWSKIYSKISKYNLSGSDLSYIADRAGAKPRAIARSILLSGSATEIEKRLSEIIRSKDTRYSIFENDILDAIEYQARKEGLVRNYI